MIHADNGEVIALSNTWTELSGYTLQDIPTVDIWIEKAYKNQNHEVRNEISTLYTLEHRKNEGEYSIFCKNGSIKIWDFSSVSLGCLPDGRFIVMSMASDVTNRKNSENKIKSLLFEKELLLKEIHHRIKNNMNTIYELLTLQAQSIQEPLVKDALYDAGSRVKSMKILYEILFRSSDFNQLSLADYLNPLCDEILSNFPNKQLVKIDKHIDDFSLSANMLQPIGIIINELLTNIMKYAFVGKSEGTICVTATVKNNLVSLIISDNGKGIPESVSFEHSTGFGLVLVKGLIQQLGGTIRIERGQGTKLEMEFER